MIISRDELVMYYVWMPYEIAFEIGVVPDDWKVFVCLS